MRYVAAYLLAVLGGKTSPASADLEKILSSVGVEADGDRVKKVISELNGKSLDEVIAQGKDECLSLINVAVSLFFAKKLNVNCIFVISKNFGYLVFQYGYNRMV